MRTVEGAGSWPGRAEGTVVWLERDRAWERATVADRAAEILRLRAEWSRAGQDLELWSARQGTVEARLILQDFMEALAEDSWGRRACSMIDSEGVCAEFAAVESARQVGAVMGRSDSLRSKAERILSAARWLAQRLSSERLPLDAIVASSDLSPPELLDLRRPALLAGPEPLVVGSVPVVWGVPGLGPDWARRRVQIDGRTIRVDIPDPRWWSFHNDRIRSIPVCYLNGDIEAVRRMQERLGQAPAVIVHRLDDLAAVPVFVAQSALTAVDLDQFGPARRLRHPGLELLIQHAAAAAAAAGVPFLAGGQYAQQSPERWLSLGFTGFYGSAVPQGGLDSHALRRRQEGGL